jgi:hypothetical protein
MLRGTLQAGLAQLETTAIERRWPNNEAFLSACLRGWPYIRSAASQSDRDHVVPPFPRLKDDGLELSAW